MLTYSGWRRYINRHYAPDLPSMFDVGRMKGGLLMLSMLANKIEKKMPLMLKMGIIFNRILFITLICALAYLAFSTWTTTR